MFQLVYCTSSGDTYHSTENTQAAATPVSVAPCRAQIIVAHFRSPGADAQAAAAGRAGGLAAARARARGSGDGAEVETSSDKLDKRKRNREVRANSSLSESLRTFLCPRVFELFSVRESSNFSLSESLR